MAPLDPLLKADERAEILADLSPAAVLEDAPADRATWMTREPRGPAHAPRSA